MITITDFTQINRDKNGNPRYVCHFIKFLTIRDALMRDRLVRDGKFAYTVDAEYYIALKKAKEIGDKKFHNKQYGGGIVFQSYNLHSLCEKINNLIA